jgi:hypothetical protein
VIGWATAILILVLGGIIIWALPKLSAGRTSVAESQELMDGLEAVAAQLGLGECDRRTLFGELVHRVRGEYDRLQIDIEVQLGDQASFVRLRVEFPQTLDQEITILSDRKRTVRTWLLRQKEMSVGDPEFERDFILLARHPERIQKLLSGALRFQLRRLGERVDKLEIGDEAVYVWVDEVSSPEDINALVEQTVECAERIYAAARELGPSPSRIEATAYNQATADIYSRVDEASPLESEASSSSGDEALR